MSIIAQPGADLTVVVQGFPSGEAGQVALTVYNLGTGAVVSSRSTVGIIELGTTGIYRKEITAPLVEGVYGLVWDDGGVSVPATEDLTIKVSEEALAPSTLTSTGGLCQAWCTIEDVARFAAVTDTPDTPVASLIEAASWVLFRATGRRYNGSCVRRVRPCAQPFCGWGVQILSRGHIVDPGGMLDRSGVPGTECSCGYEPTIDLVRYPVQTVDAVTIDGVTLDQASYRLDHAQYLRRVDGRGWPICQNLAAEWDQVGAFTIDYTYGTLVPEAGRLAAAQLVAELWAAADNQQACSLPATVQRVTRQGVTIETVAATLIGSNQPTGLAFVDAFLAQAPRKRRAGLMIPGVARSPRAEPIT